MAAAPVRSGRAPRHPQTPPPACRAVRWCVLDTSLLLGGREPPAGRPCATTPEAAAEISPGGRDARRFAYWQEAGLEVREASPETRRRVEAAARAAGNLARLSPADVSLVALALDLGGELWSEDRTVQDVARRLDVPVQAQGRIAGTLDWRPRCSGCGRWFDAAPPRDECPVCGSPVRAKPRPPRAD